MSYKGRYLVASSVFEGSLALCEIFGLVHFFTRVVRRFPTGYVSVSGNYNPVKFSKHRSL